MSHRAVFLDRDGVINRALQRDGDPCAPRSPEEFEILPGVPDACRRLKEAGFLLVVVTNQPDVGRGTLDPQVVESLHERMRRLLPLDQVEVCYDAGHSDPPDPFRKPRPGMLLKAARELDIDLARSFMVGDRWRDIDAGAAAGCTTILIDYRYREGLRTRPDHRVRDLAGAADLILSMDPAPGPIVPEAQTR